MAIILSSSGGWKSPGSILSPWGMFEGIEVREVETREVLCYSGHSYTSN